MEVINIILMPVMDLRRCFLISYMACKTMAPSSSGIVKQSNCQGGCSDCHCGGPPPLWLQWCQCGILVKQHAVNNSIAEVTSPLGGTAVQSNSRHAAHNLPHFDGKRAGIGMEPSHITVISPSNTAGHIAPYATPNAAMRRLRDRP